MAMSTSVVMKKVLLLGSGLCTEPFMKCLTRDGTVAVTVAARNTETISKLVASYPNAIAVRIDGKSEAQLQECIPGHDLVACFLPDTLHNTVVKLCIDTKVNLLTTSYLTQEQENLHQQACDSGVTVLTEMGIDPGIDHMLAMKHIDEVHSKGGKVASFVSYCGGLPAPECANNPLKYKFSWNPKSSMLTTSRGGKMLRDGKIVEYLPGGELMEKAEPISLYPGIEMKGFPNRDSVKYLDIYGIPEARTCIRGTLRYKGFCEVALALLRLGLLSDTIYPQLQSGSASLTWKELVSILLSQTSSAQNGSDLRFALSEVVGRDTSLLQAIEGLNLLSDDPVELLGTPLNSLSSHFQGLLKMEPGDRDAIFLHTTIGIEWSDKTKEERHIDLTMYGTPHGFTAMAHTVGTSAAIAAKMILSGDISRKGVVRPTTSDIYEPVLRELEAEGIQASVETI